MMKDYQMQYLLYIPINQIKFELKYLIRYILSKKSCLSSFYPCSTTNVHLFINFVIIIIITIIIAFLS